jgi:2-polyprenyl-3-methyl-5-hydroxy-6-metoxy-1,4-benzoquinol methylase
VAGCCEPGGYDRAFDSRSARRRAERYRKRGLDRTERRIVDLVSERGVAGASVLEIGGGVGEIQLELLRRGAVSATNLELSPAYDDEARRLLAEAGLEGRVDRRIADIAVDPGAAEPADVVVLNRVVCCYPDFPRLLGAAADRARRLLVFSHPPRNLISRTVIGGENLGFRLTGSGFRVFAHPPEAMRAVLAGHGLRPVAPTAGRFWEVDAVAR